MEDSDAGLRILVVEDSPTQAEQLRAILEAAGFQTEVAEDGRRGLEEFQGSRFDLVLSDILMPEMDGFTLCREIKLVDERDTPVVLVTQLTDPLDIVRGLENGADAFVTKPYEADQFLNRIRNLLSRRRSQPDPQSQSGMEITYFGRLFQIKTDADKERLLKTLFSTYEDMAVANQELHRTREELEAAQHQLAAYTRNLDSRVRISEEKHRRMFQFASDGILILEKDGRILDLNHQAERILNRRREEALGQDFPEALHPTEAIDMRDRLRRIKDSESLRMERLQLMRDDQQTVSLDLSATLVSIQGEQNVLAIVRDVTEQEQMRRRALQSEKLATIGTLSAGVAHEINTPLQFVSDNLRFLKDGFEDLVPLLDDGSGLLSVARQAGVEPEVVDRLASALEEADVPYLREQIPSALDQSLQGLGRIANIVRALKEFSHPSLGTVSEVDLNHALETAITVSRNEWRYVAELATDFDESLPAVHCMPDELNQALLNLIVNAAHAISDVVGDGREEKGRITVATRRCGDQQVEIRISDTGPGIPDEIREQVFAPFFTTKEAGRGTGQGLAIARRMVVDKHGGTLDLETEVGKGTTFVIRLPVSRSSAEVPVQEGGPQQGQQKDRPAPVGPAP